MQLEGFIFFLFFLVVFPMMVLFADHDVFFMIVSLALIVLSVKNIYTLLSYNSKGDVQVADEETEYVEEAYGIDIRKVDLGFLVAKQLFVILFAVYCYLFIHALWQKAITLFVALHAVRTIIIGLMDSESQEENLFETGFIEKLFEFCSSVAVILLIVFVAMNK